MQRTQAIAHVDGGGSALEDAKGLNNGGRHAVLGLVDVEVAQRPLGLGTPVLVARDLDLAEGIALGSGVGSHVGGGAMEAAVRVGSDGRGESAMRGRGDDGASVLE